MRIMNSFHLISGKGGAEEDVGLLGPLLVGVPVMDQLIFNVSLSKFHPAARNPEIGVGLVI